MASNKKLSGYYTYTPEGGGMSETFGPDDELPDWAAEQATEGKHFESPDEDDVAVLPAPGPGQVAGEGMSDAEKAEARKKADRDRKARERAAAKKQADDQAAVQAAQDAEAQRAAEAEAEAERQRQADEAAAKTGQGGS
jgi:hypothetical protein